MRKGRMQTEGKGVCGVNLRGLIATAIKAKVLPTANNWRFVDTEAKIAKCLTAARDDVERHIRSCVAPLKVCDIVVEHALRSVLTLPPLRRRATREEFRERNDILPNIFMVVALAESFKTRYSSGDLPGALWTWHYLATHLRQIREQETLPAIAIGQRVQAMFARARRERNKTAKQVITASSLEVAVTIRDYRHRNPNNSMMDAYRHAANRHRVSVRTVMRRYKSAPPPR